LLAAIALVPALLAVAVLGVVGRRDAAPVPPSERTHEPRKGVAAAVDRALGGALDPGPLSEAHADLAGVTRCLDCHGSAHHVIDARCVACHEEIGQRAERRLAWHGTFDEPCRTCHAEHRGSDAKLIDLDPGAFQHDQTRFPLRGAHAGAECEECHTVVPREGGAARAFRFQGVPYAACTSCHVDPHAGGARTRDSLGTIRQVALDAPAPEPAPGPFESRLAGRDCADCHRETGFRAAGLRRDSFDHDADAEFRLRGAHAAVACASCHTEERRLAERAQGLAPGRAAEPECQSCHEDPHRGKVRGANGCASCHSEKAWSEGFDHDRDTRFELDDLHAALDCGACHGDQRFRAAGRECQACHTDAADLLAGRFETLRGEPDAHEDVACADCHGPTRAANRPSALARRCAECHTPEYADLLATWSARLDGLATASKLEAALAERLRRSGAHNFTLAGERLGGEALVSAPAKPAAPR
jgi:hypothetical protein